MLFACSPEARRTKGTSPGPSLLSPAHPSANEHTETRPRFPPTPLQCSPRKSPSRRGWGRSPGPLRGSEARESRGGPGADCGLLLAQGTASPGLRRWLGSARLLRAGRPPGQRVGGPPGAPPAELGPLRGRQARDGRVLLSEQTVHLGRSRGGVTAPGAPQPVRLPASRLVSSYRVPLSVTHAHEESQGEGQEAPAGVPQGAPGAAVGGRGPHGSGGDWRAVSAGNSPGGLRRLRSAPLPAARYSWSRGSEPAFPGRGLGGVSAAGLGAPSLASARLQPGAHRRCTFRAFSRSLRPSEGETDAFIFGNFPLFFRLFYLHHAPSSEGQLSPLITGEGERNSSNTHFGTGTRAGGEGG